MDFEIKTNTMLFSGKNYYPYGGWNDYQGVFDSLDEAKKYLITTLCDDEWAHFVEDGQIVLEGYNKADFIHKENEWVFKKP